MTTLADPDILQAILAARGELSLAEDASGFTLTIAADDVQGTMRTRTREGITLLARAYDRFRLDQMYAPRRCSCGASFALHHWDSRSKKHGRPESGCEDYQAVTSA